MKSSSYGDMIDWLTIKKTPISDHTNKKNKCMSPDSKKTVIESQTAPLPKSTDVLSVADSKIELHSLAHVESELLDSTIVLATNLLPFIEKYSPDMAGDLLNSTVKCRFEKMKFQDFCDQIIMATSDMLDQSEFSIAASLMLNLLASDFKLEHSSFQMTCAMAKRRLEEIESTEMNFQKAAQSFRESEKYLLSADKLYEEYVNASSVVPQEFVDALEDAVDRQNEAKEHMERCADKHRPNRNPNHPQFVFLRCALKFLQKKYVITDDHTAEVRPLMGYRGS